jgi:type IV secretory pathway VirB4 component
MKKRKNKIMPSQKSTQELIPIKEIRDGVVVLKNNNLFLVLMASSLNFSLKSEDEQNAIILQYQNFLNSLDFPVQFFIQSRKLEIKPYISILEEAEKKQVNELLKLQTREYIEFIKNFVKSTNIVSKTFYIVVTYSPGTIDISAGGGGITGILGSIGLSGGKEVKTPAGQFDQYKLQLQQRADVVIQGLARAGIRAVVLKTEELIELYYRLYNPGELERESLQEVTRNV